MFALFGATGQAIYNRLGTQLLNEPEPIHREKKSWMNSKFMKVLTDREYEELLREKLLKKIGVDEVMDLFGVVYAPDSTNPMPREGRLSSLCPIVFEAAFEDDDPLAIQVVKDCAQKLALQIMAVLHTSEQEVRALLIVQASKINPCR